MQTVRIVAVVFVLALMAGTAPADQQQIAPGTGQQNSIVIDTGPDGICNSPAAEGDIQLAALGSGSPNRTEIRCGANKLVETIATGDDVQLIAFGAACKNANNAVVDTGEDGIANTAAAGDDTQVITVGIAPANTPCVIAGADGCKPIAPCAASSASAKCNEAGSPRNISCLPSGSNFLGIRPPRWPS